MLSEMPKLKWKVRVLQWTWIYSFSDAGRHEVTWHDPRVNMSGSGRWSIQGDTMTIKWHNTQAEDYWDVPLDPDDAWGTVKFNDGTGAMLRATAMNYYLEEGDVLYTGEPIIGLSKASATSATVVYADAVRTGGTIAWVCRNPGAIMVNPAAHVPEKYGGYQGKGLFIKGLGSYAIFPTEEIGFNAIISVVKGYNLATLRGLMRNYAKKGHGNNDPDKYAEILAQRMKDPKITADHPQIKDYTADQLKNLAKLITGVETSTTGHEYPRGGSGVPIEVQKRLKGSLYLGPYD